jgi:hypothetical protein
MNTAALAIALAAPAHLCLPAYAGSAHWGGVLALPPRVAARAARAAAASRAADAARAALEIEGARAGALAALDAAGEPRATRTARRAVAEVAAEPVTQWSSGDVVARRAVAAIRAAADKGLAAARVARHVRAAANDARWGVAVRATRTTGTVSATWAAAAMRAMRAAGVAVPADPPAALAAEVRRLERRAEAGAPIPPAVPLHARLASGTRDVPEALIERLDAVEAAYCASFRAPRNAAQSGHNVRVLAADRGDVGVEVAREWVKYSSRESHQATVVAATVRVGLGALARPELSKIDGLVTVDLRAPRADGGSTVTFEAVWLRQGTGCAVKIERGAIAVGGGVAVHGPTREAARRTLARRLREARAAAEERAADEAARAAVGAHRAAIEAAAGGAIAQLATMPARRLAALAAGLGCHVRLSDSSVAGNCDAGTADWAARHLALDARAPGAQTTVGAVLAAIVASGGDRATLALAACVAAVSR